MFLKLVLLVFALFVMAGGASAQTPPKPGTVEGHLKIILAKEVDLADQTQTEESPDYADYPLVIFTKDRKKEIKRVVADAKGNYHVELAPGDYILDVKGRAPGHLRAKPEPFTIVADRTVRVDMTIDTGVR